MEPTQNIPPSLLSYVHSQLAQGAREETLQARLIANNWTAAQIAAAVAQSRAEGATSLAQQPEAGVMAHQKAGWAQSKTIPLILEQLFVIGFAVIFLINGAIAWLRPHDFINLLSTFPIATRIGHLELMIMLAGFNDIVLGILILSRKWKTYVLAWAGVWLGLVSIIKLVSLF